MMTKRAHNGKASRRLLDRIHQPADLKRLSVEELRQVAQEIREEILHVVSTRGGHLAPSLGAVELVLALHALLDSPRDRILFDMGYQAYAHKLITGRRAQFSTLRQLGGMSGFSHHAESEHDWFTTGHAGTVLSTGLGLALARDLRGGREKVVAVIGDAALGTGMALEALNHTGHLDTDFLIVLNDNEYSIAKSVGGLSRYLNKVITDPTYNRMREALERLLKRVPKVGTRLYRAAKRLEESVKSLLVPGLVFEELGFRYFGPVNGNDLQALLATLKPVIAMGGRRIVHVITTKGKGYRPAELEPERFHRTPPFDLATGRSLEPATPTYTDAFSRALIREARQDRRIVAITAAMPAGTGLKTFGEAFPDRYFDVGIAEQHAVAFGAGLARGGLRPVVAIYSTFLQRAYDQVFHDVCIQRLPVVLAIDRAGFVGDDGLTHHGVFDLAYLRTLPNMTIASPKDPRELEAMVHFALQHEGPVALRYPRGGGQSLTEDPVTVQWGQGELLRQGEDGVFIGIGVGVAIACEAAKRLAEEGASVAVINARFVKPLDEGLLLEWISRTGRCVTIEDAALHGGFGSAVMELLERHQVMRVDVRRLGVPDRFVEHGRREELLEAVGLTPEAAAQAMRELVGQKEAHLA